MSLFKHNVFKEHLLFYLALSTIIMKIWNKQWILDIFNMLSIRWNSNGMLFWTRAGRGCLQMKFITVQDIQSAMKAFGFSSFFFGIPRDPKYSFGFAGFTVYKLSGQVSTGCKICW